MVVGGRVRIDGNGVEEARVDGSEVEAARVDGNGV